MLEYISTWSDANGRRYRVTDPGDSETLPQLESFKRGAWRAVKNKDTRLLFYVMMHGRCPDYISLTTRETLNTKLRTRALDHIKPVAQSLTLEAS